MGYTYYNFKFRFLNEEGKPKSTFAQRGIVDEKGVWFSEDALLRYVDIYDIIREHNYLVFVLYPAIAAHHTVTDNVLPESNSIVLDVPKDQAFQIKAIMDERFTAKRAKKRFAELEASNQAKHFKTVKCPRCRSTIDLTFKKNTPYAYCDNCELVFNQHRHIMPNTEEHKICPECGYFNRVQYYPNAQMYFYGEEKAFSNEEVFCCDSCADRLFQENIRKNTLFLVGLPKTLKIKFMQLSNTPPTLKGMTEANRIAFEGGDMAKAFRTYQSLILHNEFYPGVHYNYGKAYLDEANRIEEAAKNEEQQEEAWRVRQKGVKQLRRSLQGCANFKPTLELLADHGELEYIPPEEDDMFG